MLASVHTLGRISAASDVCPLFITHPHLGTVKPHLGTRPARMQPVPRAQSSYVHPPSLCVLSSIFSVLFCSVRTSPLSPRARATVLL